VDETRRDMKREQTQSPENQENDSDRHQHGTSFAPWRVARPP
jgi:hypothetical protein